MEYVIIGGDAAGMSAAMQVFKYNPDANITIFEKGSHYSYAQCGLPYVVSHEIPSVEDIIVRNASDYRDKFNMNATTHQLVEKLDTQNKLVYVKDTQTGDTYTKSYDKLLLATGAKAYLPQWVPDSLEGIYAVKSIEDITAINQYLKTSHRRAIIVGGGYIALEMAESLRKLGLQVKMLLRDHEIGTMFDKDMQKEVIREAETQGVELCFGEEIKTTHGRNSISAVTTNKKRHIADLLIVATGIRPNTSFLESSGIVKDTNGAIKVNEHLETNVDDVYAAGDCALQYHRVKDGYTYVPLGTHANKQGRIAGLNMVGRSRQYKGVLGTSILRFFNLTLATTGITDTEAEKYGYRFDSYTLTSTDIAGYFPGKSKLVLKMTYDVNDFSILGAQIIGGNGVDKRIDVISTAIFAHLKVADLEDMDLAYAPPFNSVWDPVQRVARKIMDKI